MQVFYQQAITYGLVLLTIFVGIFLHKYYTDDTSVSLTYTQGPVNQTATIYCSLLTSFTADVGQEVFSYGIVRSATPVIFEYDIGSSSTELIKRSASGAEGWVRLETLEQTMRRLVLLERDSTYAALHSIDLERGVLTYSEHRPNGAISVTSGCTN